MLGGSLSFGCVGVFFILIHGIDLLSHALDSTAARQTDMINTVISFVSWHKA